LSTQQAGIDLPRIALAAGNVVGDLGGLICDGAKPGCAMKAVTAVDTAIRSALMALKGFGLSSDDGLVGRTVEDSLRNLGRITLEGMFQVDPTMLDILHDKAAASGRRDGRPLPSTASTNPVAFWRARAVFSRRGGILQGGCLLHGLRGGSRARQRIFHDLIFRALPLITIGEVLGASLAQRASCNLGKQRWTNSTPPKRLFDRVVGVQQGLFAFILGLVPQVNDANDVLQETNLILWRKREEFRTEAAFWPWARTIAHFQILAHLKRHSRDRLRFSEDLMSRLTEEAVAQEAPSVDVEQAALGRCIEELPPPSGS